MAVYFNNNKVNNAYYRTTVNSNFEELNKIYFNNVEVFVRLKPYYFIESNVQKASMGYSGKVTITATSSGLHIQTGETWAYKNCIVFATDLSSYIGKGYYLKLSGSRGLNIFGQSSSGQPNNPPPGGTWVTVNTDISLDSIITSSTPFLGINVGDNKNFYIYDLYIHV